MDIKPMPANQTSLFLTKDGTDIFRLICLVKYLDIVSIGQIPHPKRAAKRYIANKSGKLICQHRISEIFLPPVEMSDFVANRQSIVIKEIKVVILAIKITRWLSHNLLIREIFRRLIRFSSSVFVILPRKISSSSTSASPFDNVIARSITFSSSFTFPG